MKMNKNHLMQPPTPHSQTTVPVAVVVVNEKDQKTTMAVRYPDGPGAEQKTIDGAWKAAAQVAAEYHASWLNPV
jgi:hypothetical protein